MEDNEKEARSLGWTPKEEFRGSPERWIDADEFLRRGREVMPILKATNRRLEEQVQRLQNALSLKSTEFDSLTQSVAELKEYQVKEMAQRIAQERSSLREQLKEARDEGDTKLEGQIEDRLDELKELKTKVEQAPKQVVPTQPQLSQEFLEWSMQNPWFQVDQRKTGLALGIGRELQAQGISGKAFYARLDEELQKSFGERSFSKTEGGSNGNRNEGSKGKSYDALPPDAQAKCDADAKKFVGKGKAFANLAEWRSQYANLYFAGE